MSLMKLIPSGAALTAVLAFGQTAPVHLAATRTASSAAERPAPLADSAPNPSAGALLARIDAQQKQIDELKALVIQLSSRVDGVARPVASTRPILPSGRVAALSASAVPVPAPAATPAAAQAKPAPVAGASYRAPRELLPDIGEIGAEVGFLMGGATNPFQANRGMATGGFIDLPFKNMAGGKLSYEIMLGLQRSQTGQSSTSGVNVLANAIVNSYLGNTAANQTTLPNYLAGPRPITSITRENAKVLTVAPVLLKYAVHDLGRFRPYIVGGLGMYVWIGSNDNSATFNAASSLGNLANVPVGGSTLGATLNAILRGTQIGGLAPASPELAARGVPQGQGNLLFGGQFGGGFEYRVTPKFSIGFDVRRNQLEGTNASFNTFSFKPGLHW